MQSTRACKLHGVDFNDMQTRVCLFFPGPVLRPSESSVWTHFCTRFNDPVYLSFSPLFSLLQARRSTSFSPRCLSKSLHLEIFTSFRNRPWALARTSDFNHEVGFSIQVRRVWEANWILNASALYFNRLTFSFLWWAAKRRKMSTCFICQFDINI